MAQNHSRAELSALLDISLAIRPGYNARKALRLITRTAKQLTGAGRASVFVVDNVKNQLITLAADDRKTILVPFGKGIVGRVITSNAPVHIPDATADKGFYEQADRETGCATVNLLCTPLRNGDGKAIGALEVLNKPGTFSARDEEMLEILGTHAGKALELKEEQEKKAVLERQALLGTMLASIIHDMKNPLSGISGYAQLIKLKGDSPDVVAEYAQTILDIVSRLEHMNAELFGFVKGQPAEPCRERVAPGDLVRRLVEEYRETYRRAHIELDTEVVSNVEIYADPTQLARVLENIVRNAREAIGAKGKIHIRVEAEDAHARIAVSDTGSGIPASIYDSVFDPFVTSGKDKGTGLGMAIAKQYVENNGGTLSFDSTRGTGTTFYITMPLM